MKLLKSILLFVLGLSLAMCGTYKPVQKPAEWQVEASGDYAGKLSPAFYYTEALKRYLIHEEPAQAQWLLHKALEEDSLHSPSLYEMASIMGETDPARALPYARKAVDTDSTNLWYKNLLAKLLVNNQDYDQALDMYKKLVVAAPHDADNYRMLAALYAVTGNPFAAIITLDSAEYKLGMNEALSSYKRELLMSVKLYDKAIEESERMIELAPYNYENYLILGTLYSAIGKDSLVEANYNRALELNPGSTDVLIELNKYYQGKNVDKYISTTKQLFASDELTVESKISVFRKMTSDREFYGRNYFRIGDLIATLLLKYPNNYDIVELYATHLIAGGSLDDALNIYKTRIEGENADKRYFQNIVDIEAYLKRDDSVTKYSAMALERYPDDHDLYMRQAYSLTYLKKYDEALKVLRKALKYADTDSLQSVVLGSIGDVYHETGAQSRCYGYYDRALKKDADNVLVLNNYAYYLSEENEKLDTALKMAERVMELNPGNATYIDTYGWVLYQLGRYQEARKALQQAVSLDATGSSTLYVHYGDVLYKLGENFMASVYWQKALDAGYNKEKIAERLKKIEGK
jgi:tetratricopeptide (TPR) repeat protein